MIIATGTGRMVNDPEMRSVGTTTVTKFRMVWDTTSKGEKTGHFMDVSVWGQPGEFINNYGAKGRDVVVSGVLKSRKYDKDGVTFTAWEIDAREARFVGGVRDDAPKSAAEERTVSEVGGKAPVQDSLEEFDPFAE